MRSQPLRYNLTANDTFRLRPRLTHRFLRSLTKLNVPGTRGLYTRLGLLRSAEPRWFEVKVDRPVCYCLSLSGETIKGGFPSEEELRLRLYPDHELYTLKGRRATLTELDCTSEEGLCVPGEQSDQFRPLFESGSST